MAIPTPPQTPPQAPPTHAPPPHSQTLQTVVQLAVSGAAGDLGWLAVPGPGDDLVVAAATAQGDTPLPHGERLDGRHSYGGFVIETSQPVALELRRGDERAGTELAALGASSGHLLAVPCVHGDTCLGVLEVVAGDARGRFDLDDVELVTLLGSVAGAAIDERLGGSAPPSAEQLAAELKHLAASDPGRFATVSRLVAAVLGP